MDLAALDRLFAEAQRTTTMQAERAVATDEKASQLLRFNAVLLGILVAAVSLTLERSGLPAFSPYGFLTSLFILGFTGLCLSTFLAVISFQATDVRVGLRGRNLGDALGYDVTEEAFLQEATRAYVEGIARNSKSLRRAVLRLHLALYCLAASILAYSVAATLLLARSVLS